MKKVSLLILLVIVLSTAMMALIPTKMVRLTIINKSEFDVFMKLTGSSATDAFYYLTVPTGDRDNPTIKVFTVMSDVYDRETWQCDGLRSTGSLAVTGNIRLTFTPCGQFPRCFNLTRIVTDLRTCFGVVEDVTIIALHPRHGEPTMEKVTYFKYLTSGRPSWGSADLYNGFWNFGCFTAYWRLRTYKLPVGCAYRYQY